MEEIQYPVKRKIRRFIYISLSTLGWMIFGLALGFGVMWLCGLLMYGANTLLIDYSIPITVFGIVILILAVLIRVQQKRQGATMGIIGG